MPRRLASQSFVDGTFSPAGAAAHLASAWEAIVRDDALRAPLDHPGRLLSTYFRQRRRSSLGDAVSLANVLGETCDTVFVVAGREEIASCEALVAAAAHPLHNLLLDSHRGGRPRVIYLEPTLDTDLLQGAIDLVRRVGEGTALHARWAVVVIAPANRDDVELRRDLREAAAPLVAALRESAGGAVDLQSRLIVLDDDAERAGELITPGISFHTLALERCASLLDGPALFLSALVGADSISQLKGAVWFWEAAKCRLAHESKVVALAELLSRPGCRIATWLHALEPLVRRLADGRGIPVVPAYAHAGRSELAATADGPTLHLWSETVRRDPLRAARDGEESPEFTADALRAEYLKTKPEAELRIRRLNDIAIGELCQWFSAARLLLSVAEQFSTPRSSVASQNRAPDGSPARLSMRSRIMSVEVTWLGHNCWSVKHGDHFLLIDPFLNDSPTAPVKAADVSPSFILLSHGHGDHVGDTVEIAKRTGAVVISNYEICSWLAVQGVKNTVGGNLGGWSTHAFGSVQSTLAFHSSQLPDGSYGGNPGGFLIKIDGKKLYFACDTALFGDMQLIGAAGLDLAVVPIGDLFTMGPDDAVQAVKWLKAKQVAPCHYDTWPPIAQNPDQWSARVATETTSKPVVLKPGESLLLK